MAKLFHNCQACYFLLSFLVISFSTNIIHGQQQINAYDVSEVEPTSFGLTGRIVNGTEAALRQFPYQVSLRRSYSSRHFCGGSIIGERHVLTAGHCMYLDGGRILPWTILVVAGQLLLDEQSSTSQRRGVDKIFVHPKFNLTTLQNDVSILLLKVPFSFTLEVTAAPLMSHALVAKTVCQVAGWGYPAEDYPIVSDSLMYIDIPILERDRCKELLVNVTDLPPGMFCAGYEEGQRDACQGDSGGGMICNGLLTGIVSGGEGCARPGLPGVYTDIYFFEDWIYNTTDIAPSKVETQSPSTGHSGSNKALPSTLLSLIFIFINLFKL